MTGGDRRLRYAKTCQRGMTDVIYALKDALSGRANRNAFVAADRDTISSNTAGANAPFIGRS